SIIASRGIRTNSERPPSHRWRDNNRPAWTGLGSSSRRAASGMRTPVAPRGEADPAARADPETDKSREAVDARRCGTGEAQRGSAGRSPMRGGGVRGKFRSPPEGVYGSDEG